MTADIENTPPVLTDDEIQAIEEAMDGFISWKEDNVALHEPHNQNTLAVLRKLLNRARLAARLNALARLSALDQELGLQ